MTWVEPAVACFLKTRKKEHQHHACPAPPFAYLLSFRASPVSISHRVDSSRKSGLPIVGFFQKQALGILVFVFFFSLSFSNSF